MALARLEITAVRNLRAVKLPALEQTNVFYGENGSGKTSVLESLFLLGMGRSFRSSQIKSVITHGEPRCTVFGEVGSAAGGLLGLGVSRDLAGGLQARIGGAAARSTSELAEQLPLQVVNAESFNLLVGSPGYRRQFLDWGVFHVEHRFHSTWQRFQKALKQRNSLLRHGKISPSELHSWNRELSEAGEQVDQFRRAYFALLHPDFVGLVKRLSPELADMELRYRRGWDKSAGLAETLLASERTDRQQGFTHVGPQRADVKVLIEGRNAAEVLSRGQQKLVVCALKLAQGQLLGRERGGRSCLYLVDDLPAELDKSHCRRVAEVLNELQTQVFITCVERKEIEDAWPSTAAGSAAMFHVEHGQAKQK